MEQPCSKNGCVTIRSLVAESDLESYTLNRSGQRSDACAHRSSIVECFAYWLWAYWGAAPAAFWFLRFQSVQHGL